MTLRRSEAVAQRLQAAKDRVREAADAETARGRLRDARRVLEDARGLLGPVAPRLAEDVERFGCEVESFGVGLNAGDKWGLVREILALRAEGVPSHRIAHALIGLGICRGTGSAGDVKACMAWVRKQRQRWRLSSG